MPLSPEFIGALSGIVGAAISTAIGWGTMTAKIEHLEAKLIDLEKKCVSNELFNAIVSGMKEDLHEMKGDIKKLLELYQ